MSVIAASSDQAAPDEAALASKVFRRLLPILFACYVMAFLDRINFGFAAITMNKDLGVSLGQFGLAGTLFYAAYLLFEVPSNLLLARFGARMWIARIMISWALASMGTALATGATGLYIARALLGAAEAGFVPGVLLYLTYWVPAQQRGRATALFMTAQPVAMAIGAPVSGLILSSMNGVAGLHGWQWLFVVEGLPTILLAAAVLRVLPDRPSAAAWLTPSESQELQARLAAESDAAKRAKGSAAAVYFSAAFLALAIAYLALVACLSTLSTWTPLILKDVLRPGTPPIFLGLVAALPALLAAAAMPLVSASSDRRKERGWHCAVVACLSAVGWYATTIKGMPSIQVIGLVLCTAGGFSSMPILWTLPPVILPASSRPIGIAVLSCAGIAGSIISPMLNGYLRQATGSFAATGLLAAGCMLTVAVLVLLAAKSRRS